ncbi:MAG: hypothetical protein ACLUFN_07550 [Eubacterium sp.]
MQSGEMLYILKCDLQMTTKSNDNYLEMLLKKAKLDIEREGIVIIDDDLECEMAIIHYAAYLFRKRAAADTAMPRFLRFDLNNILLSQKGAKNNDDF